MASFDEYRKKLNSKYGISSTNNSEEEKKKGQSSTKNTSAPSASSFAGTPFDEYRKKMSDKYLADKIDASGVDSWFTKAGTAMQDMDVYNKNNSGRYMPNYGGTAGVTIGELLDSSDDVYHYLQNHKDEFENYDEIEEMYSKYRSALRQYDMNNFYTNQYYSQFEDEDSYNAYLKEYEHQQAYAGKNSDELWGIIGGMDAGSEKEWLTNYTYSVMTVDDYDKIIAQKEAEHEALVAEWDKAAYENGYSANDKEYREYVDKINAKEAEIDTLKRNRYFVEKGAQYSGLENNPDWAEQSTNVSEDPTAKFNIKLGNTWLGVGDVVYDYINDIDGTREKMLYTGNNGNVRGNADLYKYDFMTDTQIAQYNYIYNTEGKKAANEYLDYISYDLDAQRAQQLSERNAEFATEHPFWASVASVPTNLISGVGLVDNIGQNVVQGARELITGEYRPINYNSDAMNPTIATMAIRGTVAQNLANEYGVIDIDAEDHPFWSKALNGKSFGDVYQLGMSMVDSGTVALLSPVIGTFGTALLGGAAGSQGVLDAVSRGATDKQAMLMGIFNGTFEMLFEKVSLDNLLKGNARNVVMAFLQQGFIEGSEELSTSFANNIADILIMAEKSGYRRSIAAYMDAGLTEEEATKAALKDAAMDMAWDFIGGLISGGVMGTGGQVVNNVSYSLSDAQTNTIYGADLSGLIDEALELDPNNALALRLKSRLADSKKVTTGQVNRLVNQNETAIRQQDIGTIQTAAENRLTELGETGDVSAIAAALAKQAAGQRLSKSELQLISNSKYGQRVVNELSPDNINSGEYSSAWTGTLDTNRINPTEYSRLIEASEIVQENTTPTENKVVTNVAKPSQEVADDVAEDVASPVKAAAPVEVVEETSVTPETEKKSTLTIEDASKKYGAQAGAMLHTYVSGQDVAKYDAAYKVAYDMGKSGVALSYAMNSEATAYLSENQRELAYEAGKAASDTAAQAQDAKNKQAANGKTGRRKGVVKAEGVSLAEIRSTFNDTQKTAYKILSSYAEATGIDIVLYKSEANENGDFEGAQGKFKWSEDTIYIDINAGLANIKSVNDLAKYAMLRTFAHEFTHFIEKWNPVKYNEFRKVVFDTLTERGEDVSKLIDEKLSQDSTGKMTYDMASREVVAEAMTDILPDANFVQELAENHKNIFQKLLEKLKDFVAELKAYYNTIGHNRSREANALKEQVGDAVQYVENIVKMFDEIAVQAVETYQQTVAVEETTVAETTTVEETTPEVEETTTTEVKEPVSITDELGFTITDNVEHGSLEISFEGKPSEQVRDVLKDNKFRWHKNKKVWYGYADRAAITDALRAAYETETVEQPAEEQPTDFETTFKNATEEERNEVVEALDHNVSAATPTSVTDTVQSEAVTPAQEETTVEEAKKELRKAVRMPIQGTNAEALLQGIKSKELSMESITLSGQVDGFTAEQREHLVTKLIEGVYTDNKTINIDVPYDGKFEIENTPASVAKVLNELKVKVTQEIIFDKQTVNMLQSSGKVVITEFNGQKYISNGGAILLPISDVGVEYARKELKAKDSQLPDTTKAILESATNLITKAPLEAKHDTKSIYIFDTGEQKMYFDKKLLSFIDGGLLYSNNGKNGMPLIKSVNEDGSIKGYLLGLRIPDVSKITGEKPSKLRSFAKKMQGVIEEVTNNGEKETGSVLSHRSDGQRASRLLGEMETGTVQGTGTERNSVDNSGERGVQTGRSDNRADAERSQRGHGEGSSQSTDLRRDDGLTPEEAAKAAEKLHEEVAQQIEQKSTETPKGRNFVIGESLDLPNGEKARYKANIEAIRLVKQLEAEGRYATEAEQAILSKYVGWGGLANAFDERKAEWAKEYNELKELLTEEEYNLARGSTLNAHYTDISVIKAMYDGLAKLGFDGGRMLEPSSGVGNFVGAMPVEMSSKVKSWTMVELDGITGLIAKYLYPNADVRIQGFEKANIPNNYMDVAISNVPFGNYPITDKAYPKKVTSAIHNYFFAKTLDKVRPGGIVMFITSSYTMNSKDSTVRRYIMQHADLLGAIRLPDTAFKGNAGTEVVTDILILKKRAANTDYAGVDFLEAPYQYVEGYRGANINSYFAEHPEMVLGTATMSGSMYRGDSLTYKAFTDRGSLADQIREAFTHIEGKMDYPATLTPEKTNFAVERAGKKAKNNGLVVRDGKVYQNKNGDLVEVSVAKGVAERISGMLEIRDAAKELQNYQQQGLNDTEIKKARLKLNKLYDAFVKKYGYINAPANRNALKDDPDKFSLLALENWNSETKKATKSDIFSKNTIAPNRTVTSANDVSEGLIVSVNQTGTVDVSLIAKLTGKSESDVTRELIDSRQVFKNRDGELETAEVYLSGNVRAKLRDAEALVPIDSDYAKNVEALKAVMPEDVGYQDIFVNPGTPWIPASVYSDFAAYMLGTRNTEWRTAVDITYNKDTGNFTVELKEAYLKHNASNTQKWGTSRRSFLDLFSAMLNSKSVVIKNKLDDGSTVIDKDATAAANEKIENITKEFQEWLWQDEARRTELATLYNETFNSVVTPTYNGDNLTVNGANAMKPLRPHQRNAVQRIISSGGNTLLAHKVGAGKTYEMAAAAMKLKQLGLVKKPMFAVPKPLVAQWGTEFMDFFPTARLLVAEASDFTAANRKVFANRIANGDYDAVIVSYEQFEKLPISDDFARELYQEQIDSVIRAIEEAKAEKGGKSLSVKDLEKKRKSLQAKIDKLTDKAKDEDNIEFEQLGVDSLFIDEAHNFKNLFYTSSMTNVSGLGNKDGSKRAFDLFTKVRYLQKLNGGRGIVFATATPVMNSMSEMYIMQRYLQPDLLDQLGISSFDAWAKQFGEVVNGVEIKPSGQGYRVKQSFSRFKNMSELQLLFRNFADVLTDIPGLKIPKMKGGQVQVVVCEPGQFQQDFMKELEKRADNVKNVDPSIDNMLKITSDGRKISYTQRMIDPTLPYEEGCKIYRCADNVIELYNDSKSVKGTQLIFCDMATPKGKSATAATETEEVETDMESARLYDDIKARLVKGGIPAKEIAFIHEADTDVKKKKLFADVNEGKVRVLIGSTGKMGVGMNAQKRIVAIHHLDAPWRPGDVEQRNGRAFRQGNINDEVMNFTYVTEGSFDARLWDILDRKQGFINQIMNGENVGREAEDTGEVTLSAAEVKALASGSPLIMEQVQLDTDIKKLESLHRAHISSVRNAKDRLTQDRGAIATFEKRIAAGKADLATRVDTYSEGKFSITVGKSTYTDKKDAGAALVAEATAKATTEGYTTIGKFAGFELRVVKTHEGIKGLISGKQGYSFNTYPNNPTYGINHLIAQIEGISESVQAWELGLEETKKDMAEQEKLIAQPFARQAELDQKRARYNEVMEILNPKEEQALDTMDEDTEQHQSRTYLNDEAEQYSYDWFINKPDMAVTTVSQQVSTNRSDIVKQAKKNAAAIGNTNNDGSVSVHVNDIDTDVLLSTGGLRHSLDRRFSVNAPVTLKAGEILQNSIRLNELVPSKEEAEKSYVLIGAARNESGELYIVRSVVNRFKNELVSMDVLYAINAKKEPAALLPRFTDKAASFSGSVISIAELLDYVNEYFPDILPESVLKHYGHNARPEGELGEYALYQQRTETLTDREVLVYAAEEVELSDLTEGERDALSIFQKRLTKLEELQNKRAEQGRLYKEQQFGAKVDRAEAAKTLERMKVLDSQIEKASAEVLSIEDKAVLKRVLQKARTVVEQQERVRSDEKLKRWRDRRNNADAIKKYRERVRKDVNDLTNWILHPNNKDVVKHIPDVLKESVIPFLSSINFMSKQSLRGGNPTVADKEFIRRLEGIQAAIKTNIDAEGLYSGYNDLPPDFMDSLQTFISTTRAIVDSNSGEFVINQMTSDELRELSKVVRTLKKYITQVNKFHANAMFEHVYEAGDDSIASLKDMGDASSRTGNVSNFVLWQQIRPAYAFERFGDGGIAIYDGLRRGQATLAFNTKKIQEFAEKAYTAKEVQEWEKEIKEIEIATGTVRLPVSTIMSFYELSKREQALGHILGMGVRVATYKNGKEKISDVGHRLSEYDIKTIISALTPRQMEVADNLQQFMAEQGGKWGNYVSVKRFGEELFGEKHYFPIHSDGRHLQSTADEHPSAASLYALLNMSFTKELTQEANNRIILYSIFDVFANHMASMAQYNAFALPMLDALKWFNYQQKSDPDENGKRMLVASVREEMSRVYGVPEESRPGSGRQGYAETFVMNILKAFNGTEAQGVPTDATGLTTLRRYNMAQVAYNFRVVVQQPLAITRAALLMDYASIVKGMKLSPKAIQKNISEMQQYSGIAAWKALGFYDINISRGLTEVIKHKETTLDKIREVGMWGAEKADLMTWAGIWSAAKEEVIRKQKLTPNDTGFYEAVTKLFEDVIYKTQVVDSVLTKNEYLRSKGFFARAIGSFMSEPSTTASMLIDAYDKFSADMQRGMNRAQAWKKNRRMIGRVATVYAVSAIILSAVQAIADAARDDDDYQTFLEKWLEAFGGNLVDELMPLNKLPILSDFYEVAKELIATWTGADIYGNAPQSVFMQWYDSLVKGSDILHDLISGEDTSYTWYGGIYKLLQAVSGMSGLPMAAATREIVTAWNNTIGAMAPSLKIKSYDPGDKSSIRYAYQDGFLTADEAIEQLISQGLVDTEDEAYWLVQSWEAGDGYSRYTEIYDAVRNGGDFDAAMDELTSHGYTEKDVLSNVKGQIGTWYKDGEITKQQATTMLAKYIGLDSDEITKLVNNWQSVVDTGIEYSKIKEEYLAGNITFAQAVNMRVRYGGYTQEKATEDVNKWKAEKDTGLPYDDKTEAFKTGEISAPELINILVDYGGYTEEKAAETVVSYTREAYEEGYFDRNKAANIMMQYGGLTNVEAETKLRYIDFKKEYPDIPVDSSWIDEYYTEVESSGIAIDIFVGYRNQVKSITGDDKKARRMAVIDSLPITDAQKDALYYAEGWAASKLYEAPWH